MFIHSLQNILEGFYCSSATWAVLGTNCFVEDCFPGARADCAQAPGLMSFSAQRHSQQRFSVAPTAWAGLWIQNSPTTGFLKIRLYFEVSRESTDFSLFQKLLAKHWKRATAISSKNNQWQLWSHPQPAACHPFRTSSGAWQRTGELFEKLEPQNNSTASGWFAVPNPNLLPPRLWI